MYAVVYRRYAMQPELTIPMGASGMSDSIVLPRGALAVTNVTPGPVHSLLPTPLPFLNFFDLSCATIHYQRTLKLDPLTHGPKATKRVAIYR